MPNGAGLAVQPSISRDQKGESLRKIEVYKQTRRPPLMSRSDGEPYISPRTSYHIKTKIRELVKKGLEARERGREQRKKSPKKKSWLQTAAEIRRRGRASRRKTKPKKHIRKAPHIPINYPPSYVPKHPRRSTRKTQTSHALKKEREWWEDM